MLLSALAGGLIALGIALPLAWKWELGVRRVGVAILLICAAVTALTAPLSLSHGLRALGVALLTLAVALAILAWRFYRDPDRQPPPEDGVIVSPADGEVLYVRHSEQGALPVATKHGRSYDLIELTKTPLRTEDVLVVGIAMSFLDVHVNRAPMAGSVKSRDHHPGLFGSLGNPDMVFENERLTTVIEHEDIELAIVQIASRLVRQIVSYVNVDEKIDLGQRIGVIRLGSQVDVVLPRREGLEVTVKPGERLRAGESVLGHYRRPTLGGNPHPPRPA